MRALDYLEIDANGPTSSTTGCRVIVPDEVFGRAYDYSVSLLRHSKDGEVAVLYNVHDGENFDLIKFRYVQVIHALAFLLCSKILSV